MPKTVKGHFMQDGASCHMSKSTEMMLRSALPKGWTFDKKGEWPANSPDLNPIENIWAILKDSVIARAPRTVVELREVLEEEWWAIPQGYIRALIESMPTRLDRIRDVNGGRFKKVV